MNRTAIICLSTGSILLAVCIVLTVLFRAFHVYIGNPLAYTGVGCAIVGLVVLVVGIKYTGAKG